MYKDTKNRHYLLLIIVLVLVVGAGIFFFSDRTDYRKENVAAIEKTIMDRALQCYVVEGVYPPDLAYLEEHYGLTLNKEDYFIHYEIFAENLPPIVRVVLRNR